MRQLSRIYKWILIGAGLLAVGWIITGWLPSPVRESVSLLWESDPVQAGSDSATRLPEITSAPTIFPTQRVTQAVSPTPDAPPLAKADFFFSQPASDSEEISPIQVEAEINTAITGSVRLELVSSDGRVLSRKVFLTRDCGTGTKTAALQPVVVTNPSAVCIDQRVHLSTNLPFGMSEERAIARLQIMLVDKSQHVRSLTSMGLTLLTVGKARPTRVAAPSPIPLEILQPPEGGKNQGESLIVSGMAPLTKDLPLRVEVVTESGLVINTRMALAVAVKGAKTNAADMGEYQVEIDLKRLKSPTKAIVIVSVSDEDVPGMKYVASRAVFLDPGE